MTPLELEGRPLAIYPCRWVNKAPTCPGGFHAASTDPEIIDLLWSRYPGGLLTGVATGTPSGIAVLDIDPKHNGEAWLAEFEATHGFPSTRIHATRSGGVHFIFKHRPGLESSDGRIAPGVDVKSDRGGVIWWPAAGYRVLCEGPVAPWPAMLDEALAERSGRGALGVTLEPVSDTPDSSVTPRSPIAPIEYEINYAKRALSNACLELRDCPGGSRNHLLNVLAYKMGRLIARGWVKRKQVEACLWQACEANGRLADPDDGETKCRDTLRSGIEAGMKRPYHDIRGRVEKP
jgi:hypothetical protein